MSTPIFEYFVYECQACCLGFAVETAEEDQSVISCPDKNCGSELLRYVGVSEMTMVSVATEVEEDASSS